MNAPRTYTPRPGVSLVYFADGADGAITNLSQISPAFLKAAHSRRRLLAVRAELMSALDRTEEALNMPKRKA